MSQAKLNFAAKVLPPEYVIVHSNAITWLYENHPEIYEGFYNLVDGGPTPRALDECYCTCPPQFPTGFVNGKDICTYCYRIRQ